MATRGGICNEHTKERSVGKYETMSHPGCVGPIEILGGRFIPENKTPKALWLHSTLWEHVTVTNVSTTQLIFVNQLC